MPKISLKINKDNFTDLIQKLNELSNINDVLKLKITSEKLFIYSLITTSGDSTGSVLAMKYFNLNTDDYIKGIDDKEYHFVLLSCSKFIKNLKIMSLDNEIKMDLIFRENEQNIYEVRNCQFFNGRLKLSYVGGVDSKIKDINYLSIEERFNPKKANATFNITKEDFISVKKLSSINSEENIFNINIKDGIVTLFESGKWELEVDNINFENNNIFFTKKYLSNINIDSNNIEFMLFETFIVVKDDISSLLCSFEQTFSDE